MTGQAHRGIQVATNLPPSIGRYAGWDWQTFYNAILHMMQNRASQQAHSTAYRMVAALPANMTMTPQEVAASWARFIKLYPGWKDWEYNFAYSNMLGLIRQTGRLIRGNNAQWFQVEAEWKQMELPQGRPSYVMA